MGREKKGPMDWHGVEELSVGCRTHVLSYVEIVLKDMANITFLDSLTYILIITSVPFGK